MPVGLVERSNERAGELSPDGDQRSRGGTANGGKCAPLRQPALANALGRAAYPASGSCALPRLVANAERASIARPFALCFLAVVG